MESTGFIESGRKQAAADAALKTNADGEFQNLDALARALGLNDAGRLSFFTKVLDAREQRRRGAAK